MKFKRKVPTLNDICTLSFKVHKTQHLKQVFICSLHLHQMTWCSGWCLYRFSCALYGLLTGDVTEVRRSEPHMLLWLYSVRGGRYCVWPEAKVNILLTRSLFLQYQIMSRTNGFKAYLKYLELFSVIHYLIWVRFFSSGGRGGGCALNVAEGSCQNFLALPF